MKFNYSVICKSSFMVELGLFRIPTIDHISICEQRRECSAYYMAVFSCVPLLGLPLGAVAIFSGISGLVAARANPAAKGVVHAWIGVILGSVTTLTWLAFLLILADRFTKFVLTLS